jgi:hypothetical protein
MSTNYQKKYGFTSLSMKKEIDKEFGGNNNIHYSNTSIQKKSKKNNLAQSNQENAKYNKIEKQKIGGNKSRNKSAIKISLYKSIEKDSQSNDQLRKNKLRESKVSKDKDKNSSHIFRPKADKKKNLNHIERIIIDLVSNDDENESIHTESDQFKNEQLLKSNTNKSENKEYILDKENQENKDNNINPKEDSLKTALNIVGTRWINNYKFNNGEKFSLLADEVWKQKKEIENAINRWKKMEIINEKEISYLKEEKKVKENEMDNNLNRWKNMEIINENKISYLKEEQKAIENKMINDLNRWKNNLQKENKEFFTLKKYIKEGNFLYSENDYIKDLIKNIYIPQDNENTFCFLNNNNFSKDFNHIDYKIINSNNKEQLEKDLQDFYKEKKLNYLKNKDNNEELKINPIYVINDKQIEQIYKNLNKDIISNKKENINPALSIEKQKWIDFEIIEVFTPKNKNKDNNTNPNSKRLSAKNYELKNDKVSEVNYEGQKKSNEDFGQETPFSMLDEKFNIYAVSKNNKYSVPEMQKSVNYLNQAHIRGFNLDLLQKTCFSLKIEACENSDSNKMSKNENIIDNNVIDYSKNDGNSNSSKNK